MTVTPQAVLRGIFTVVDVVAIAKTMKICFTEETLVLQYEDGNFEPIIAMAENTALRETYSESQGYSNISYIVAGLFSGAFVVSQVLSNRKKSAKNEEEETKLRILCKKLVLAEN